MCMSCNTKGLSRKRKIIIFSSLGSGIATVSYLTFTATSNPAVAATVMVMMMIIITIKIINIKRNLSFMSSRQKLGKRLIEQ
jgi:hypothetical protein